MQTNVAEIIYERVKGMTIDKQREVLRRIEKMDVKDQNIWDKLEDLLSDIPDEEFDSFPIDASANIDHYLYGSMKK